MAVAFVGNVGTGASSKNAGTSFGLGFGASVTTVEAGSLLVAQLVFDNAATASKPIVSSISKGAGETNDWVFLGAARSTSTSAGAFASGELWAIKTSVTWATTTLVTVTFDTSITMKAFNLSQFTGVEAALRSTVGTAYSTTTAAASATTTGTTPQVGDLALGFTFGSNVAAAQAGDTDVTSGSWSSVTGVGSTGGSGATNNFGIFQYKILTGTTQQTFNNSALMTAGNGSIVAILQKTIDPLVTQAAYRFYADGTETGATALAGQDTAPTVDISSGDVNLGLRMRLQETNGGALPATTDWTLQWEKNVSGSWTDVAAAVTLAITYPDSNQSGTDSLGSSGGLPPLRGSYVSIQGNGQPLRRAGFKLHKQNAPTGNLTARLYAHTGTYGSGTPTGSVLATSTTSIASGALTTTSTWAHFDFNGSFTLASGTNYFIGVDYDGAMSTNLALVGADTTSPTYAGNGYTMSSTDVWTSVSSRVPVFEVYTGGTASTVVPYDSPNLTDAAATTSRLTGGGGSFVAGKVSEDGLIDDLGWSASNHTEPLYSLTLKQADLAPSDTLRFRVLKNGATTDLTYMAVPSVTIGAGGPATIQATAALVAASTLTATAVRERATSVTLTAASTLTTTGVPSRVATVALSAASTLTATGTVTAPAPEIAATAALTAASTLTATGVRIPQATVSLVAASTLTATGTRFGVPLATVALAAVSTLSATGVREPQATASLTATSTLTATGSVVAATVVAASVALAAASTLTATGIRTQHATSALVGASQLTTGAVVARVPVVALSAVSTLTATAVREPQATVSLTAASTLTAAATTTPAVFGTVAMSAAATLSATAVREPQAAVSLATTSTLTATAVREPQATVGLTAVSTLTATAVRVVIVGGAAVPYLTEVLTDAPSVLWLFDEAAGAATAADSSGNGKTGTKGASISFGTAGSGLISGYPTAARFTGTGSTANLLSTTWTALADGAPYTLEAWVRTVAGGQAYAMGSAAALATSSMGALLAPVAASGLAGMRVWNTSSTQSNVVSVGAVNDGQPHHLVGVASGSSLLLYLDGVLDNTAAITGTFRALLAFRCGGTSSGAALFTGDLAGIAFYPTALTPERVAAHYAAGTGAGAGAGVPLSAVSTLTASAITFGATGGAAVLTASSTLTATAVRTQQTTAALSAVSTLTATATTSAAPVVTATAALAAASTLTATAVRQPQATVSLTATAVLTVTGVRVRVVAVALTATSTLTATPTRVRPATVPLTAAATLTVQLVRIPQAFVGMTATSVLVATATVTAAAVGIPNAAHTGFLHALDADLSWYPVTVPS